jgi:uncharacterized protein YbgA (DUF1722 family)
MATIDSTQTQSPRMLVGGHTGQLLEASQQTNKQIGESIQRIKNLQGALANSKSADSETLRNIQSKLQAEGERFQLLNSMQGLISSMLSTVRQTIQEMIRNLR